jgi:AraC family transcriptional regulator
MQSRIEQLKEKKLIGKRLTMSFANNLTGMLWSSFMPRRNEIKNTSNHDLISMQLYAPGFFENFNANTEFEKWAAVEVDSFQDIPQGMETFILPAGLYAVFNYKGDASTAEAAFRYIFEKWIPNEVYDLDNRPHFEILGEKFKRNDPDSEEEIWIPVKLKS